mmetsp:Transcript_58636/g.136916  ORF Transcript_58636/g.136916 Transcript_58636/m.136916 type:complete len:269 (+) Transcript_58636:26-832(+)
MAAIVHPSTNSARPQRVRKVSPLPAVLRHDPALKADPELIGSLQDWWGGTDWDPREQHLVHRDFTDLKSTKSVLQHLSSPGRHTGILLKAMESGDVAAIVAELRRGAGLRATLNASLRGSANPEVVWILSQALGAAALNDPRPEPVTVLWARYVCRPDCGLGAENPRAAHLDALLANGADINAAGGTGDTALHVLASCLQSLAPGDELVSRVRESWHDLTARGADILSEDSHGAAPLQRLNRQQAEGLYASERQRYGRRRCLSRLQPQ